jgi:hypothetical protein
MSEQQLHDDLHRIVEVMEIDEHKVDPERAVLLFKARHPELTVSSWAYTTMVTEHNVHRTMTINLRAEDGSLSCVEALL